MQAKGGNLKLETSERVGNSNFLIKINYTRTKCHVNCAHCKNEAGGRQKKWVKEKVAIIECECVVCNLPVTASNAFGAKKACN